MSQLENKLEAILFYKNEPLKIKEVCKLIGEKENIVREVLQNLAKNLEDRGICLIMTKDEVSLATAPEISDFIGQIAKDEMSKDISKAALETLAIILYNEPITRRKIDYIRGVNSTFILRNLCMRGLVEKEIDPNDQRIFVYKSNLSLLAHLGINKVEELPEFEILKEEIIEKENDTG